MKNKASHWNTGERICDGFHTLGTFKQHCLNRKEKDSLRLLLGSFNFRILHKGFVFSRILKHSTVICSKQFTLPRCRNSFTVCFTHNGEEHYGQVIKYVKFPSDCTCDNICSCTCTMYIAFIEMFKVLSYKMSTDDITSAAVEHIVPCERNGTILVAVPVEAICSLCVFMDFENNDTLYLSKCPNTIEGD